MGLLTRELPDPHWLLWCDSSLTGSTRIPAYEPRPVRVRLVLVCMRSIGAHCFSLRFCQHHRTSTRQRAYSIQDSCVSNSSVLPPMPTASWGGRRRFGPLTRLTARHQSPRLA